MMTITPDYLAQQRELHARPQGYGGKGFKWAPTVLKIAVDVRAGSILDYGCGQGSLLHQVRAALALHDADVDLWNYDPAIPGYDTAPEPADLVVCTDVLEHIEPDCLASVLAHLRRLTQKALFLVVALDPANKTLRDGRNAHLIQETPAWWQTMLTQAGFRLCTEEAFAAYPLPVQHYQPEKRSKRWMTVAYPC